VSEISGEFETLSLCFRSLGTCHLLEFADIFQFRENLTRSGHSRRHFLKACRQQGNLADRHLALSHGEALFDSAAYADWATARDIARLSITEWSADWEYEDDFCYYQFLQTLIERPVEPEHPVLTRTLARFEKALEGQESLRLSVCKTLLDRNQDEFLAQFGALIREIGDADELKRPHLESHEFLSWPCTFVSVEGLALLKVAELLGLDTGDQWPHCPALARRLAAGRDVFDIFEEIERQLAPL